MHYKLGYVLKVPTPMSASMSFGTSIHETLREFYGEVSAGKKPVEKLLLNLLSKNWLKEGYTDKNHEKKFFEKGKLYLSGFLKEGYDPKNLPKVLEQPFVLPLQPATKQKTNDFKPLKIGGKIDRIDVLSDGTIEIIDYKTGATVPTQKDVDKNLQLSFYALAATQIDNFPFKVSQNKLKLSLYYLDTQEKLTTIRTDAQLEEAVNEIFRVREEIKNSDFKCSNHIFCQKGCEFSLFCNSD